MSGSRTDGSAMPVVSLNVTPADLEGRSPSTDTPDKARNLAGWLA
jgi:hypothetical protein